MGLSPTLLLTNTLFSGPKHSTSVPSSSGSAVPLSVDVKEVASIFPGLAVKASFGPQSSLLIIICDKTHRFVLPFTLQRMIAFMPLVVTVQLNVIVSPGHRGELGAVNCPSTSPVERWKYLIHAFMFNIASAIFYGISEYSVMQGATLWPNNC